MSWQDGYHVICMVVESLLFVSAVFFRSIVVIMVICRSEQVG